jgi:tetratricopeptide (TPR) repeat protein
MWVIAALFFFQAAGPGSAGMKALEEGRYLAAEEAFREAVAADAGDYSAHFNLALALGFLHRDLEGIAEYQKTLALKPGLYQAQLNLGILMLRQNRAADAEPLLESAANAKPAEFRPRFYLAEAQLATGDAGKAEQSYRRAVALDGKSAGAQLGLARALAEQGKLTEAPGYFHRAAELDPAYRDGLLELAALYEKNKQPAEAIEIYGQFADNPVAQEHLGALLLASGQYRDAIAHLEEAYLDSPSEANRVALAMAYTFNNQGEKAVPLLEKAVAEEPGNFDLRLMYAHTLRDRKQYQAAAGQFDAATKLKPDDAHTWNELGSVLYLAEAYQPALAAFDRARELGEANAGNWFLRGIILDKLHQIRPALEAYRQFLSLSHGKNPDQEFQARERAKLLERELGKR